MDGFKRHIPIFLTLGMLAILVIIFRSFLMTNIIEPIAYLCWAAWWIVSSVNQNIYWAILVVVCSILMIRLIPTGNKNAPSLAYNYTYKTPTRVEYWQILIKGSMRGNEESEHLRNNLKKLFVSVIAQVERFDPTDLEEVASTGAKPLSLRAQSFLFPPKGRGEVFCISHWLDIISLLSKRLRIWAGTLIRQDAVLINEILERLETEMEITHDR